MRYKIILTAFEPGAIEPYHEDVGPIFENYDKAEIYMLRAVNDELSYLNKPDENNTPTTSVFIADLDGDHDAIIRMWDGDDYWTVGVYDITEVSDEYAESEVKRLVEEATLS